MFQVEGVDYSPEGVEDIRQQLVRLRDEALEQGEFHWSVILSHAIAHAAHHVEMLRILDKKGDAVYVPGRKASPEGGE